jgi:hypothetical protein
MSDVQTVLDRSRRLGLTLRPEGSRIAIFPGRFCPPDLLADLRAHKRELLDWLEARAAGLTRDCAPWLHVARQVLAGEFDGADKSTVQSLTIGLRGTPHPHCLRALNRLNALR